MIPRFAASELEEILEALLHMPTPPATPVSGEVMLDAFAEENGAAKTQDDWIEYWRHNIDGRIFASAANYYQAFKQLQADEKNGNKQQEAEAHSFAEFLRKDFKENWIVTSTRIIYHPPGLEAEIIQHYGNKNQTLQTKRKLDVPEWLSTPIMDALQDRRCLPYLQAVFGTADPQETIISTLRYISGVDTIKLWTPPFKDDTWTIRKDYPKRAVGFDLVSGGFLVVGDVHVDDGSGRSRGVRL